MSTAGAAKRLGGRHVSAGGYVAVLVIDLHFPDVGSLKGKRKELSSIKAQLHGRMGVAVAETDHQDLWQRATLTAALTGGSLARLTETADTVERWLRARCADGVQVERVVLSLDELRDLPVQAPDRVPRFGRDE